MDDICSICYNDTVLDTVLEDPVLEDTVLYKSSNITTECNHKFHKKCLLTWYKIKNSCPYCRQTIYFNMIVKFTNYANIGDILTYKKYKRKSVTINGIDTSFIEKNLKFTKLIPVAWLNFKTNTRTEEIMNMHPLYLFDNTIYITAYTRLAILYNSGPIKLSKQVDINDVAYYISDTPSDYIRLEHFILVFEWIFDLLHSLKREYNFIYKLYYNTIFCDLLIETIIEFDLDTEFIQGVSMCAIHNILKYDNIHIPLDELNYYTLNIYDLKELQKYNEYQQKYLETNMVRKINC